MKHLLQRWASPTPRHEPWSAAGGFEDTQFSICKCEFGEAENTFFVLLFLDPDVPSHSTAEAHAA